MRHVLPALILTLSLTTPVPACLNYYGKNIGGYEVEVYDDHPDPRKLVLELTLHPAHDEIKKRDLGPEPASDLDYKVRNDYAANLVRQGKTHRAIEILESIEQGHPGEYIIAANLGTAYELSGDVDRAYQWISEGMKRYPDLHLQTEWLHLRILEVKRQLAKDPNWLRTHSVLDVDFGREAVPEFPRAWDKMGQERVLSALQYQLHERLAFVVPPDAIVGELLGIYANAMALKWPVDHVIPLYDLALSFRPVHSDILEKRREQAMRQLPSSLGGVLPREWGTLALGIVVAGLAAMIIRRRSRARATARA